MDFLSLPAEDSEALQSYLSPKQKALLDQGAGFEPGLVTQSAEQLQTIVSYCLACVLRPTLLIDFLPSVLHKTESWKGYTAIVRL